MKKIYRIKKKSEIDAIFKLRKMKGNNFFVIYHANDSSMSNFRYAISIGKKYGNAVSRNLMKRRIRYVIQTHQNLIINSKQFVVVVKPNASTLDFNEIQLNLLNLLKKSQIMENLNE